MLSQDVEDRLGRLEARLRAATLGEIRALHESWHTNYLAFRVDDCRAEALAAVHRAGGFTRQIVVGDDAAAGWRQLFPGAAGAVTDAVLGVVAYDLVPSLTYRALTWPVFEVFGRCWEGS